MANEKHLAILQQGVEAWNEWREENRDIRPDLNGANLSGAKLGRANLIRADLDLADLSQADLREANFWESFVYLANLSGADLRGAILGRAVLSRANLSGANLKEANLSGADLFEANLRRADLRQANLTLAHLREADLRDADLREAILTQATLVRTKLENATLSRCEIYGISAWDVKLEGTTQSDLIISDRYEAEITVDNLEVAQFVYMLLHNEKIRDVISTIGKKGVLILGRFGIPERKGILEAMRTKLREKGYLPIVFDFEKAVEKDWTETIKVLAGLSLFVIADITNPKSSPLELQAVVPDYMIPFVPIIQAGEAPFSMFVDLQHKYQWVMDVRAYNSESHLLDHFESKILHPALAKHNELIILKNEGLRIKNIDEF